LYANGNFPWPVSWMALHVTYLEEINLLEL